MFASGDILLLTNWVISCTPCSVNSEPPVMLISALFAPVMSTSSNGLSSAMLTASRAPSPALPVSTPCPTPIHAGPAFCMTVFTSAKSTFTSPASKITFAIPSTPSCNTLSAIFQASSADVEDSEASTNKSFGILTSVSTSFSNSSIPAIAFFIRCVPSKVNGRVTTPIVSAPSCLAIDATMGAPPVPVPPPIPAVTKTKSAPYNSSVISRRFSSWHNLPIFGSPPTPIPRAV